MPVAFAMNHVCARVALEQSWKNECCRSFLAMKKNGKVSPKYSGQLFNLKNGRRVKREKRPTVPLYLDELLPYRIVNSESVWRIQSYCQRHSLVGLMSSCRHNMRNTLAQTGFPNWVVECTVVQKTPNIPPEKRGVQ